MSRFAEIQTATSVIPRLPREARRRRAKWGGSRYPQMFLFIVFLVSCSRISPTNLTLPIDPPSSSSTGSQKQLPTQSISLISPDGSTLLIKAEVAADNASRQRGLMFRQHLDSDAGMLFIFEDEQPRSFWMKNTLIPLDILFFDGAGNFVSSSTMHPCLADPCLGYPSAGAAQYALELNAGFVEKHGVGSDWKLMR